MNRIFKSGHTVIWEIKEHYGSEFYVYSGEKLVRVCPSVGMAREVAAGL